VNLGQSWRPLRHTSDDIRHCAGTTVGQTLLIDGSDCNYKYRTMTPTVTVKIQVLSVIYILTT